MALSYDEAFAQLTAAGAPFEMGVEDVLGLPMRNWKKRERNMREKVAAAGLRGDLDFIVQGDRRISYEEFAERVWGAAHVLESQHGFQRGDRLAVLAYNSPDWLMTLFGAVSLGGIGVGLNGWWAAEELAYGLEDSGSRFLVVDAALYPRVEELAGRLPHLEQIFFIGDDPPPGTLGVETLLERRTEIPDTPIDEDDPFVLLYTSGTTGRSKGCITTHRGTIAQVTGILFRSLLNMAMGDIAPIPPPAEPGAKSQNAQLLTSPLFHVGGLHSAFCVGLTVGSKLVLNEGRFDPEKVMQLIQDERINMWGAIPTMLHRIVHHEKVGSYDLSSLRTISFGGAPTAPETLERAREVLPVEPGFTNAYGLTETHGVATTNSGRELLDKMTAAGRPMPLLDFKVVDEAGAEVADGTLGELLAYGPLVTPGYWNRPEATAETIRDGWLYTGDLGYRDEDGFLFVVDRAKDMILRGGENVYCVEIENCLAEHPEIDEAAVVGIPDAELGERVKAVVHRIVGSSLNAGAVQAHVARHLARFKVPEVVEFTDTPLPRNPAGKLLKNQIREAAADGEARG